MNNMSKTADAMISFSLVYFCNLKRRLYSFDIITHVARVIKDDKIYAFRHLKSLGDNKNSLNKVGFNIRLRHFD